MASIFTNFDNCLKNKAPDYSVGFSSWLFCRYLAGYVGMINYANAINCYSNQLSDASQYAFIQSVKKKPNSIRWIIPKSAEIKSNEELENLMRKYNISQSKAQEYLDILKYKQNSKNTTK